MADNGSNDSVAQAAARKKVEDRKDAFKAAGKSLSSSGQDMMDRAADERITPVSLRKAAEKFARLRCAGRSVRSRGSDGKEQAGSHHCPRERESHSGKQAEEG